MAARVLLALPDGSGALADALRAAGHVLEACPPARLRPAAAAFRPAVCLVELGGEAPGHDLLGLLEAPGAPAVLALTDRVDADEAAQALERGVDAVLPRAASPSWVRAAVRAAVLRRATALERNTRREALARADGVVLLGSSPAVRRLREGLERVASTPRTTVLVTAPPGEEGAAVARLVHGRSTRAAGPLVELLAGSRPDVEAAEALGPGGDLLQRAEGGTLVLHRVAHLGPLAQQALLRVLDERGCEEGAPDVRLVATTCVDLEAEVRAGRFREELLYRLNVLSLPVPALSERLDDLAELARACLEQRAGSHGLVPRLGGEALEVLRSRAWPGGLAELWRTLEAALSAGGTPPRLDPEHLAAALAGMGPAGDPAPGTLGGPGLQVHLPDRTLRAAEEALIRQVLAETDGNKLRSAEILGIHRTTLYHKLRDYGIDP